MLNRVFFLLLLPVFSFAQNNLPSQEYVDNIKKLVVSDTASQANKISISDISDHKEAGKNITKPKEYSSSGVKLSKIFSNISIPSNNSIDFFINYYKTYGKRELETSINRMVRIYPLLKKYINQYDLPSEVLILGILESDYQPSYSSMNGGKGIWGISKSSAKVFNLTVNDYVDERMDIQKSTDKALSHLKNLIASFNGDIDLAIATYSGAGSYIYKKIRESQGNNNFWDLITESQDFENRSIESVPRFYAILSIIRKASFYKFDLEPVSLNKSNIGTLNVNKNGISLKYLANKSNIPLKTLIHLNPQLYRDYTIRGANIYVPDSKTVKFVASRISKGRSAYLKWLPKGARAHHQYRVARKKTRHQSATYYKVRSKDSLYSIAKKYSTTVSHLAKLNHINSHKILSIGRRLKVSSGNVSSRSSKRRRVAKVYHVKQGDTLYSIAKKYHTSIHKIHSSNGSHIKQGDTLTIQA